VVIGTSVGVSGLQSRNPILLMIEILGENKMSDIGGTGVQTSRAPATIVMCVLVICGAGCYATLRALIVGDAYDMLAFGTLAFASGLAGFRIGPAPSRQICLSVPVIIACVPFLGPAASVPALLASCARLAGGDKDDSLWRLVFQALRLPAAALAGGIAYVWVSPVSDSIGGNPMSPVAFGAAILAFALVEMVSELAEGRRLGEVFASAQLYALAAAAAVLISLWLRYSPRSVVMLTGVAVALMYALALKLCRESAFAVTRERRKTVLPKVEPSEAARPSLTDPLTGLANDRYLYMFLQQEIGRSVRKNAPMSLLLLDIDDFQVFNETFGKDAADAAMVAIGDILKALIREYDIVARCASDEFAVVLPEAKGADACETADRIRESITAHDFGVPMTLCASIGVATYPEHGLTPDNLMSSAHHALNRAKFAGKNRVMSCAEALGNLKYGT